MRIANKRKSPRSPVRVVVTTGRATPRQEDRQREAIEGLLEQWAAAIVRAAGPGGWGGSERNQEDHHRGEHHGQ